MDVKRVQKMLKLCRKYLHWIQNSVFEGDLTEVSLKELKSKIKNIVKDHDSVLIFRINNENWVKKEVIGIEKRLLITLFSCRCHFKIKIHIKFY
jgi:CRISPR-associated protein Cas2